MNEEKDDIKYISKVEIKGLWERYDLEWNLHPDVNILSGINGSGKSTILGGVYNLIKENRGLNYNVNWLGVLFNNQEHMSVAEIHDISNITDTKLLKKLQEIDIFKTLKEGESFNLIIHSFPISIIRNSNIDNIDTFDNEIDINYEKLDKNVKTELDKELYISQKLYLDYQINIGKRAFNVISKNNDKTSQQEVLNIKQKHNRFLEIIDSLFKETDKKIDREKNEVWFLSGDKEISPYQLSSGEKQILVILLTVLVQDNKPSILFMDEPEISLHIDWQKKLIGYIRELNPNVQIILATHSPALIMEGWTDKVFDVRDLITKDYLKN